MLTNCYFTHQRQHVLLVPDFTMKWISVRIENHLLMWSCDELHIVLRLMLISSDQCCPLLCNADGARLVQSLLLFSYHSCLHFVMFSPRTFHRLANHRFFDRVAFFATFWLLPDQVVVRLLLDVVTDVLLVICCRCRISDVHRSCGESVERLRSG